MANDNYGTSVSRTLSTDNTRFANVVWQAGKPPLDSELNLVGQLAWENQSDLVRSLTHSGFLLDPRDNLQDFVFNPLWSNYFEFGSEDRIPPSALVNGWVLPLAGSDTDTDVLPLSIKLPPPPTTGTRTDFVFLEVWKVVLPTGAASIIKPANGYIYDRGNVVNGKSLEDELVDPEVGFETTKRVQVQYRLRVEAGVDLTSYVEGFYPSILAQGPTSAAAGGAFTNDTSDKGLWRATHGDTADGYVYALPIGAVFRRNSSAYIMKDPTGGNQNGAINRKPSASSVNDAGILTQATLTNNITASFTGSISISNLTNSGIDDADFMDISPRLLILGEGLETEVVSITSVGAGVVNLSERGRAGTQPKRHIAGTKVSIYNGRPDGKYADEVHAQDFLDMRHAVRVGEWDYQSLLVGAVSDLIGNKLRTTQKQNSLGSDSRGVVVEEVSLLHHTAVNNTHKLDAPNGIRNVWSDTAVPQYGITLYLDPSVSTDARGLTTATLDSTEAGFWEIGADLQPNAFLYPAGLNKGSAIFLSLDASVGNLGYGVKGSTPNKRGVRLLSPKENAYENRFYNTAPPVKIELQGDETEYYPKSTGQYETPFMVLGDLLSSIDFSADTTNNIKTLYLSEVSYSSASVTALGTFENEVKVYAFKTGTTYNSAWANTSIYAGETTYETLILNGGEDLSGRSSELYALIYGDPANPDNNGLFRVISAGVVNKSVFYENTTGTEWTPANREQWIVCLPVGDNTNPTPVNNPSVSLSFELRTEYLRDTDSSAVVAITSSDLATADSFYLSLSVQYPAGLGGTANVADDIHYIGVQPSDTTTFLRNAVSALDPSPGQVPSLNLDEITLPSKNHLSLWNRLGSKGWGSRSDSSSLGLSYGGVVVNNETDREAEAFYDSGSKTILLQAYQKKNVILHTKQAASAVIPPVYLDSTPTDDAGIFETTHRGVFVLPQTIMPRFGRQDIPLHTYLGSGDSFLNGLNHLFTDVSGNSDAVFNLIGGRDNHGTANVYPMLFDTAGTSYGTYDSSLSSGAFTLTARKVSLSVPTSDFGAVLNGIELPPFLGIARVYGVYERSNYDAYLAQAGGHDSTRINPVVAITNGSVVNLLRTDTSDFTMYIRQGGADVDIGQTGCHTYVLTEHALDITRIPTWTTGNGFDNFEYIVEAVVFGFAQNFINQNRFVMMRNHNGLGTTLSGTDNITARVGACIPFALPVGAEVGIAYSRTPYQGNVYHTQTGIGLNDDDQVVPYGRLDRDDAYTFSGSRLQDTNTVENINLANPKNLQVLASMDFYTTLGTGGIGGNFYPSTLQDSGYSSGSRMPTAAGELHPQTTNGVFNEATQGTKGFVSLFLFTNAHPRYNNATAGLVITLTDTKLGVTNTVEYNTLGVTNLSDAVGLIQKQLVLFEPSYKTYVITGFPEATDTKSYICLLIEAPTTDKTHEISVNLTIDGKTSPYVGQDFQLFEGAREKPLTMLFNSYVEGRLPSVLRTKTKASFVESVARVNNAGEGNTPLSLVGLTSRLPLGVLVRDFDFLCEDILNDGSSYLGSNIGQVSTRALSIPVDAFGQPYTQVAGVVGDTLQLCDGDRLQYTKWNGLSGSKNYLIARGGGSVFGVSGESAGGPLTFLASSFGESEMPVLKGSVLAGRAMLVKNSEEVSPVSGGLVSRGDEIQLLIVTYCVDPTGGALSLGGEVSPSGYGEGYAAADRFRIRGLPLIKSYNDSIQSGVRPAPYNP